MSKSALDAAGQPGDGADPRASPPETDANRTKSLGKSGSQASSARWTFLSNHAHVLILLAQDSTLVLREVALKVGITERAVQRIIADLEESGVLEREKVGRQNHYRIQANRPLRHPIEQHRNVQDLIDLIVKDK